VACLRDLDAFDGQLHGKLCVGCRGWPAQRRRRQNRNLELFFPVKSGHTLTFSHEIDKNPDKVIRDKWGIIRSRNEAFNHRGELALRFFIDILAERAPK